MSHGHADTIIKTYNELIDQIGEWVVYTRSDKRFRCRDCYDIDTHSSPPGCGSCFGTGYRVTLERWLVFWSNSLRLSNPATTPMLRPGEEPQHHNFVFTRHTEVPVENDRFFIVEWNRGRDEVVSWAAQPVRMVEALRIQFVERLNAGRNCYYMAHCEIDRESLAVYERSLLRTPLNISRS